MKATFHFCFQAGGGGDTIPTRAIKRSGKSPNPRQFRMRDDSGELRYFALSGLDHPKSALSQGVALGWIICAPFGALQGVQIISRRGRLAEAREGSRWNQIKIGRAHV